MPSPAIPELPGVTHRDVHVRGVRLHVAQAGEGPPLVLLHGWPQHWYCYHKLIPALARDYTVIAPDMRGWGWSEAPRDAMAKATFAADIVALLDHDGLDRVRVIGHDWGGYTAFLLALDHPERVERMVALDIVPPWPSPARPSNAAIPVFLIYQVLLASPLGPTVLTRSGRFVRTIIRAASGPDAQWSDDELDMYADVLREPARARASSACYRTFLTREVVASARGAYRPGQLEVPSLLLMGGASSLWRIFRPVPSRNLAVDVIPRAGHFVPDEAPDAVLERARPFLEAAA
jgi:pimeloyl-ACP methyl ester carboxylesterase